MNVQDSVKKQSLSYQPKERARKAHPVYLRPSDPIYRHQTKSHMLRKVQDNILGHTDDVVHISQDKFKDTSVVADSITFLLEKEKPLLFLRAKVKEFIFTDKALVYLERDNVTDVKRAVKRYDYMTNNITNIEFLTPGYDGCTLTFTIGTRPLSIEYSKSDTEIAKANYKVLVDLSLEQKRNGLARELALNMLKQITLSTAEATDKFFDKLPTMSRSFLVSLQPESYEDLFKKNLYTLQSISMVGMI